MLKMNSDLALLAPSKPFSEHLPIQFDGVHLSFGKHHIFSNLTLEIGAQGITAIMGPNGAGKSLILRLLAGLLTSGKGSVRFNQSNRIPRDQIGFVFQQFNLLPRTSALENVELPLVYAGVNAEQRKQKGMAALEKVGLASRYFHTPAELSGGQQQRVAIARALVNQPPLIFADEPTGALDSQTSHEIMLLLWQLNQQGITVVLVTHEPDVAEWAKRKLVFKDGLIIEDVQQAGYRPATSQTSNTPQAGANQGDRI